MRTKVTALVGQGTAAYGLGIRLAKFCLVGGSGVIVDTGIMFLLVGLGHWPLLVAKMIAGELAIANNFFWNNQWTFGRADISPGRFVRFNVVSIGGLAIAASTLALLHDRYGIHYLVANLIGIALATAWNFALNVVWTWRARA